METAGLEFHLPQEAERIAVLGAHPFLDASGGITDLIQVAINVGGVADLQAARAVLLFEIRVHSASDNLLYERQSYHASDSLSFTSFLARTREQSSHRFLSASMVSL